MYILFFSFLFIFFLLLFPSSYPRPPIPCSTSNKIKINFSHHSSFLLFVLFVLFVSFFSRYMKTTSSGEGGKGRLPPLDSKVASSLFTLSSSRRNTLYVVSGSDAEALSSVMAGRQIGDGNTSLGRGVQSRGVARVGLAAQHGFTYRPPGSGRFSCLLPNFDAESASIWQDLAIGIMQAYRTRTNGAFTWRNESTCGFSYVQSDPEFGDFQAKSLTTVLVAQLRSFPVQVVCEAGSVFVAPEGVDKGAFVQRITETMEQPYDFVLCVGDGASDENMFKTFKTMSKNQEKKRSGKSSGKSSSRDSSGGTLSTPSASFTVTVGAKPSDALYYLTNVDAVHEMLQRLASSEKGGGMRRSFSTTSVDRNVASGLGGLGSSKRGSMGLLTKEVMRGSRSNLQDMQPPRKKVHSYSQIDTRTSKEGAVKEQYVTKELKSSGRRRRDGKQQRRREEERDKKNMIGGRREEKEGWQTKLWKAKWFLLAAVVSMMILRRR